MKAVLEVRVKVTVELEVKAMHVEAEGYKPVESRAISDGYCRRGAVRRRSSECCKNSTAKDNMVSKS